MAHNKQAQVIVVGAGIAGLTAASELHQQGIDVLVLEAAPRIGGRVTSVATKLGSHLDLGGQWIGHGHHRLTAQVKQANGRIYKTYSNDVPQLVYKGRKLSPLSPLVLLGVVYLLMLDLMSRLFVPWSWNSLTAEAAIARWVPTDITRQLLRLVATLSSTAELHACSVYAFAHSLPLSGGLLTMTSNHGGAQDSFVVESMACVTDMLAKQLGSRMHTSTPVVSIHQEEAAVHVWTVDGQQFSAARVIVTVPPPMLTKLSFNPPLPDARQALQRNTRMGVVYKAVAVFERPFWRAGAGGDFLVLDDPACGWFDSSPPTGPGHLCLLVPGTPARQLDGLTINQRRELLLSQLVPFLGRDVLQPLEWHEKSWQQDEFCGGGYLAFPVVGTTEGLLPMPHKPFGHIHWAGTETAQEHPGYIEGAMQSGERSAREVASLLNPGA